MGSDGYTLTFASLLLSIGSLADRIGAKTAFLSGLALFILTSAGCGLAENFWSLTLFRFVQGAGAALMVPTSLALLNATYQIPQERIRAIGIWASIGGIAAAAGPILGALLTTWFSWRAIFYVNIPAGILAILLTIYCVSSPKKQGYNKERFDWAGQFFGILSIAALSFSLIEAGRLGWLSSIVIISFFIFIVAFITFLMIEKRMLHPMLPLSLFQSKVFSISVFIGSALTFGIYGELFVLTLYFQEIRKFSVLATGFAFLPLVGITTLGSYLSGVVMSKMGIRTPTLLGLAVGTCGLLAMLITNEHTPSYWALILPLAAMGFGISFTPSINATINSAPPERAGIAAGISNTGRQIGSLLGVAIFGTILNTSHHFMTGMHLTFILAALAYLAGFLLAVFYIN